MFKRALLLSVLLVLSSPFVLAQKGSNAGGISSPAERTWVNFEQPPAALKEKPLVFKAGAHMVLVPVVVQDKDGNPISGLKKEDFGVFEDGAPQAIESFEEVTSSNVPLKRLLAPKGNAGPSYEATNKYQASGSGAARVVIIAIDVVNTPVLNQYEAHRAVMKLLSEGIDENCVVQLVAITGQGLRIIHDFSDDSRALKEAARKWPTVMHEATAEQQTRDTLNSLDPLIQSAGSTDEVLRLLELYQVWKAASENAERDQARRTITATMRGLYQIASSVAGLPGRKSLVWVTGSFRMSDQPDYAFDQFRYAMQALERANVAVYPLDARGLTGIGLSANMKLNVAEKGLTVRNGIVTTDPGITMAALGGENTKFMQTIETLNNVADATGGTAYYNRNDLDFGMRQAARDTDSYYMLTYRVDKKKTKAGWRKLSVKVAQPKAVVRTRRGYYLTQAALDPSVTRNQDMDLALASPVDFTAIPFTVRWELGPSGKKRTVTFEIAIDSTALHFDAQQQRLNYDFAFRADTDQGAVATNKVGSFNSNVSDDAKRQLLESGLTYRNKLELEPGNYGVHFAVRDNTTGRVGSVWASLHVPVAD